MRNNKQFRVLLIFLWFLYPGGCLMSQPDELFKITRNKDSNEIIYYLNTNDDGQLDLTKPIEAYWIRYDLHEKGRPLNSMERKYAYGLKFSEVNGEGGTFQFVSFDRELYLVRKSGRKFVVQVENNGVRQRLEELYLNLGGGSFWFPKVNYIELRMRNEKGELLVEQIKDL